EFIYEQPATGDTEYIFKHALTQEVAYSSVLLERRKVLHERIGAALEVVYGNSIDEHVAELAHHYGRSGNVDLAVQYLTHAGKQKMEEARLDAQLAGAHRGVIGDDTVATVATLRTGSARGTGETAPGVVDSLWRYPVKSMAGEEVSAVSVTLRGVLG